MKKLICYLLGHDLELKLPEGNVLFAYYKCKRCPKIYETPNH